MEGSEKCAKCTPGYIVKIDHSACVKSPHPACIRANADEACEVCAGPYWLDFISGEADKKTCYEKIANCLI